MAKRYDFALFPSSTPLYNQGVADGEYIYKLDGGEDAPLQNILNIFYFIDADDNLVPATGGQVEVTGSPDGGVTWLTMNEGSFDAVDSESPTRIRPSGIAQLTHARVTLSGIAGAGITGFFGEFIQTSGL
jgi:hypothetical protein